MDLLACIYLSGALQVADHLPANLIGPLSPYDKAIVTAHNPYSSIEAGCSVAITKKVNIEAAVAHTWSPGIDIKFGANFQKAEDTAALRLVWHPWAK